MHYLNESLIDKLEELMAQAEPRNKEHYQELLKICYRISTELFSISTMSNRKSHITELESCLLLTAKMKALIITYHRDECMGEEDKYLINSISRFRVKLKDFKKYREITESLWYRQRKG